MYRHYRNRKYWIRFLIVFICVFIYSQIISFHTAPETFVLNTLADFIVNMHVEGKLSGDIYPGQKWQIKRRKTDRYFCYIIASISYYYNTKHCRYLPEIGWHYEAVVQK